MKEQFYMIAEMMTSSYDKPSFLEGRVTKKGFQEFVDGPSHGPYATYIIDDINDWPKEVILKRLQLRYKAMIHIYVAIKEQDVNTFIARWEENYREKKV